MLGILRKVAFAFPFGCATALGTHLVRFGDDHAFGGEANEAIVTAAIGGSIAIALLIVHALLRAGSTTVTGTIARARVAERLPGIIAIFSVAAGLYYGIESLEGNGIELGLPTVLLAVVATLVALGLRALCASFSRLVDTIVREFIALFAARPRRAFARAPHPQLVREQRLLAARRLGRAPPIGPRSS